jgi:glutamate racemase
MSIGVFDSGIGGLTVLKEAIKLMPHENYFYYADTKHVPYGTKPKDEVAGYIFDAVDFFARQGVEALVVACNTATSIAINDLRVKYSFPIIGMEPAVKPAVEKVDHRRVLVLATPITVKEKKLHDLVERLD